MCPPDQVMHEPHVQRGDLPSRRNLINPQKPIKLASIISAHSDSVGMGPIEAGTGGGDGGGGPGIVMLKF